MPKNELWQFDAACAYGSPNTHSCSAQQAGGKVQRRKINELSELAEFDLIVNCMGLGAKKLFNDNKLHPVRYLFHLFVKFSTSNRTVTDQRHNVAI